MDVTKFPHGECECRDGCSCGVVGRVGPAAYEVERDGRRLKVCTRCTLLGDNEKRRLVSAGEDCTAYFDHDALGGMLIVMELNGEAEATR